VPPDDDTGRNSSDPAHTAARYTATKTSPATQSDATVPGARLGGDAKPAMRSGRIHRIPPHTVRKYMIVSFSALYLFGDGPDLILSPLY